MSKKIIQLNERVIKGRIKQFDYWYDRPLQGNGYPYVYVDGLCLRRSRGGEYENVVRPAKFCQAGNSEKSE